MPLKPFPQDRDFWIVTDEGEAHEVAYCDDTHHYTGRETFRRQDGESGGWEPAQILGWTDDYSLAQATAEHLEKLFYAPAVSRVAVSS